MGDEWNGVTERRRQTEVCPMHGVMFESIEKKFSDIDRTMNEIANRQIEYIKSQARLEYAVSNGMRNDIMVIRERLDTFCAGMHEELSTIKGRITVLESFKWFRDLANKFRDSIVGNLLKWALLGGLVASLIYFSDKIVSMVKK